MAYPTSPTAASLAFLRHVGYDVDPDPANIKHLLDSGWTAEQVAETYRMSVRSVWRKSRRRYPCPGYPEGSCMTMVMGGGLCSFCRKTRALRARVLK